jgi:diaminohydroxyphosphoribosylaminopyrimidine deaminase / 5-amino-6-(5-phosphoribosylamino)uracil reductase
MNADEKYMALALSLAEKGLGKTSPNPAVGCVIVLDGKVVGCGYHTKSGCRHAEIEAIADAHRNGYTDFSHATIYVTLEPCSHTGKTPPCANAIVEHKFARAVVAALDPNPLVLGNGIAILRNAGIETVVGVLENRAKKVLEPFTTFITKRRAFLAAKWAQSLDGKIAAADGTSKWISSTLSQKFAHRLRDSHDVVIVGVGTLLADDPSLTVRHICGRNPIRLIVGGSKPIAVGHKALTDCEARTIFVTTLENPFKTAIIPQQVEIWRVESISFNTILTLLASNGITSALLEGGSRLLGAAFAEKIVDRVYCIVAPKIIGCNGIDAIGSNVAPTIGDAITLQNIESKRFGRDTMISGSPNYFIGANNIKSNK